jgi:hypothetical protein
MVKTKAKAKATKKKATRSRGSRMAFAKGIPPHEDHCKKIETLTPHLFEAVHEVLRKNNIEAVVHGISFKKGDPVNRANAQPCCRINGILYCPCPS